MTAVCPIRLIFEQDNLSLQEASKRLFDLIRRLSATAATTTDRTDIFSKHGFLSVKSAVSSSA
jgi:hypothetical protein